MNADPRLLHTAHEALPQALSKLDPRHLVRTPVIFVVWIGSVLTTVLSIGQHYLEKRLARGYGATNTPKKEKSA